MAVSDVQSVAQPTYVQAYRLPAPAAAEALAVLWAFALWFGVKALNMVVA